VRATQEKYKTDSMGFEDSDSVEMVGTTRNPLKSTPSVLALHVVVPLSPEIHMFVPEKVPLRE
jgi:hypothetical protein